MTLPSRRRSWYSALRTCRRDAGPRGHGRGRRGPRTAFQSPAARAGPRRARSPASSRARGSRTRAAPRRRSGRRLRSRSRRGRDSAPRCGAAPPRTACARWRCRRARSGAPSARNRASADCGAVWKYSATVPSMRPSEERIGVDQQARRPAASAEARRCSQSASREISATTTCRCRKIAAAQEPLRGPTSTCSSLAGSGRHTLSGDAAQQVRPPHRRG